MTCSYIKKIQDVHEILLYVDICKKQQPKTSILTNVVFYTFYVIASHDI